MHSYAERCASYSNYPLDQDPPPRQLISANLTSKRNPDIPGHVYCVVCKVEFYGFRSDENPYQKHCDYSPTCPWVLAERAPKTPTPEAVHPPPAKPSPKAMLTPPTPPRKKPSKPTSKAVPAVTAMTTPSEYARSTPKAVAAMPTPPSTPKQLPVARTETPIAALTPPATPPSSESALILTPPVTSSKTTLNTSLPMTPPSSPIATPRKPISWAEIASRPVVAPKPSRLPVPTPKSVPRTLETASITRQHPQKPYLTIDDLFKMFDGKHKRLNLLHSNHQAKKHASSPCVSRQAKITSYFRPAANQIKPISQGSKTPNPKSFHQRMPAESIRANSLPPTETASEKSTVSTYKMPYVSDGIPFTPAPYPGHALNQGLKSCSQWIRSQQVSRSEAAHYQGCSDSEPRRTPAGQYVGRQASKCPIMASNPHRCRRCFRAFRSKNELHEHLRCTHLEHRRRRRRSTEPQRLDQPWRKV